MTSKSHNSTVALDGLSAKLIVSSSHTAMLAPQGEEIDCKGMICGAVTCTYTLYVVHQSEYDTVAVQASPGFI